MKIRAFEERDRESLERMGKLSGFPYLNPTGSMVEACMVAVDELDRPVVAVAAERIVQLYGWFEPSLDPVAKLAVIREMHAALGAELSRRGYESAEAFLPPSICEKFGRRLERSFGWVQNWRSWCFKFSNLT